MAEGVLDGPDQGGDRRAGVIRDGAVLWGADGGGVHGTSQIMTILVMYTKACIRTGVSAGAAPGDGPIGSGRR